MKPIQFAKSVFGVFFNCSYFKVTFPVVDGQLYDVVSGGIYPRVINTAEIVKRPDTKVVLVCMISCAECGSAVFIDIDTKEIVAGFG